MTPGATDTVACVCVGLLDRIAVRSDIANWRMPSPWVIGFGISSAIAVFPVIKVTGNLTIAEILLLFSLVTVAWLIALMIRRAWCERHPYMPPRWLAVARAIMGDDLIDAALERLRDTPACSRPGSAPRRDDRGDSRRTACSSRCPQGRDRGTARRRRTAAVKAVPAMHDSDQVGLSVTGGFAHFGSRHGADRSSRLDRSGPCQSLAFCGRCRGVLHARRARGGACTA